jgi:pimeloyl-ACP methyl ester carboxylesterase
MKPGLFVLILTLAVLALLTTVLKLNSNNVSSLLNQNKQVSAPTPTPQPNIFGNEVSFVTSDKSTISATIYTPININPPYKSLVLVHQSDSDRSDWSSFVPTLLTSGYRVMVFDLRGMGKSTSAVSKEPSDKYFDSMTQDLSAAVEYLRGTENTDKEHIGVIGASMGANIAYVYSGLDQNTVSATVAISPSTTKGPLQGNNIQNFHPSNIFFITDQKDSPSSQSFFSKSSNPKSIKIYSEATAHGVELLKNTSAVSDILAWLKTNI